jgi:hypothetical protein
MHVEAMTWCGMSAQTYAKAHRLSLYSLKRWREAAEVQIDWQTHLIRVPPADLVPRPRLAGE